MTQVLKQKKESSKEDKNHKKCDKELCVADNPNELLAVGVISALKASENPEVFYQLLASEDNETYTRVSEADLSAEQVRYIARDVSFLQTVFASGEFTYTQKFEVTPGLRVILVVDKDSKDNIVVKPTVGAKSIPCK